MQTKRAANSLTLDFAAVAQLHKARATRDPAPVDANWNQFEFSRCHTDWKSGDKIRKEYRWSDYVLGQPYRDTYLRMLNLLGLPETTEIHRGTRHDMIFIPSHGVILRLGPASILDTFNPGILQPLGWIQDDALWGGFWQKLRHRFGKESFTIAVYPGVSLEGDLVFKNVGNLDYYNLDEACERRCQSFELYSIIAACGNYPRDLLDLEKGNLFEVSTQVIRRNIGFLPPYSEEEKSTPVLIDIDARCNDAMSYGERKQRFAQAGLATQAAGFGIGDIMAASMRALFNKTSCTKYLNAHTVHDGLRTLFWDAFGTPHIENCQPDVQKRAAFWSACKRAVQAPITLPTTQWNLEQDNGRQTLRCHDASARVQLHTPWTKPRT